MHFHMPWCFQRVFHGVMLQLRKRTHINWIIMTAILFWNGQGDKNYLLTVDSALKKGSYPFLWQHLSVRLLVLAVLSLYLIFLYELKEVFLISSEIGSVCDVRWCHAKWYERFHKIIWFYTPEKQARHCNIILSFLIQHLFILSQSKW